MAGHTDANSGRGAGHASCGNGRIFIEIKDSLRIVQPLAEELGKTSIPPSRFAIICFQQAVRVACKAAMPEMDAHWLVSSRTYEKIRVAGIIRILKEVGADGVDIQTSTAIAAELGIALRQHKLEFRRWTVNEGPLARHTARMGGDSITTDRSAFLRRQIMPGNSRLGILQHLSFDDAT